VATIRFTYLEREVPPLDVPQGPQRLPEFLGVPDDENPNSIRPALLRLGCERRGEERGTGC